MMETPPPVWESRPDFTKWLKNLKLVSEIDETPHIGQGCVQRKIPKCLFFSLFSSKCVLMSLVDLRLENAIT